MLSVREIDQLLLLLTGRMHRYKGPRLRGFPGIGSCFVYGKRDPIVDTLRDDTLTGIERLFSVQSANGGWASLHFACGYCQLWTSRLSESNIGDSIRQTLAGFIGLELWLPIEA